MSNLSLTTLEPHTVWSLFDELTSIPRPSKDEQKVREWIISKVKNVGLKYDIDKVGNLVVRKPATPGLEHLPTIILQAHMDMVTEKDPESNFDFLKDKIKTRILDNSYVSATQTSLGADDGIGLSIILSILLDSTVKHGNIEALFTVDEETGLTGAKGLDPNLLKGKLLLNLDSENWGIITISSAGGLDSVLTKSFSLDNLGNDPSSWASFSLDIRGLLGGHSGTDIHLPRANPIKVLMRFLRYFSQDIRLVSINAGNKRNAIPRFAFCTFICPKTKQNIILQSFKDMESIIKNEWSSYEPELKITLQASTHVLTTSLTAHDTLEIINLCYSLPHGPYRFSPIIPDLVETSNNLAVVHVENGTAKIILSTRSSVDSQLELQRETIKAVTDLAGGWTVQQEDAYSGWNPDLHSKFLLFVKTQYQAAMKGQEPQLSAIHAGLETGVIGKHFNGGLHMVAIGPNIKDAHSPREKVEIQSVLDIYHLVCNILHDLPVDL